MGAGSTTLERTGPTRALYRGAKLRTALAVAVLVALADLLPTAQVKDFQPVTDAMLEHPNPADWINWRRTQDAWGFSPLKQINRDNVHQLQLSWSWMLEPGMSEPTPLVYNGVMYLPNPNSTVQAVDAETGEFLWEYKKEIPKPRFGIMRNIAIYGDKIYVGTSDAHMVALNARTGQVV